MDLITLSQRIEERYRHYLKTTFYFKDPDLRASFEEALQSGYLSKGPYLEATPVFQRAQRPRDLFQNLLGFEPDEALLRAVQGDRPLYRHQEAAIRGAFEGRNIIVATGTGSGKTESFLYPVLLHLYREFQSGQLGPGVRALILYPMNALANDQRERLGEICKQLEYEKSSFRVTFGQYIGETPEDENDTRRRAVERLANRLPGELVLRSEMRSQPPHILLTNYSMLEYLLLRPDDSPLFDHGRARWWTFLILDEAHQYRGSKGIEMAMLLRRLKQRLREGGRLEPFRCIATSATLAEGEKDREAVAKFASNLFGEEFCTKDVILGETEPIPESGIEYLPAHVYGLLREALQGRIPETRNQLAGLANRLEIDLPDSEDLSYTVGRILQHDIRSTKLRRLITGNPMEAREVAEEVFADLSDTERVPALSELIELLLQARDPASHAPLLSVRYHLFLRSLEGAFVSYWPQKKVFLDRKGKDQEIKAFEVALCRECGQHYFIGPKNLKGGKLEEAIRDPGQIDFGATFLRPQEDREEDDIEEDYSGVVNRQILQLCVQCGEIGRSKPGCNHDNLIQVVQEESPKDEDRADQVAKCGACGYSAAGRDPVREVIHGADGPNAVIATTLYQSLPEKRKKILAFTDGRQEAAFFAWYLEDSYRDILNRNLILRVVQRLSPHVSEGLSLRELATNLRDLFIERRIFPPTTGSLDLSREAWLRLYREFLTDESRISLEGVGLVRWLVKWPVWFQIPEILRNPPWSLTEQEAWDLLFILLDFMRAERALELRTEPGISVNWSDLKLQGGQTRVRIGEPKKQKDVRSWDGKTGRRAQFLTRLLIRNHLSIDQAIPWAIETLRAIWETLKEFDQSASPQDRLLLPVEDARRLNPDWWRVHLVTQHHKIFRCDRCGRLQTVSVRRVCPRPRCLGTLNGIQPDNLEPNHYRWLYEEDLAGPMRVEEHTAQLDHGKAREFQDEFKEGRIHVLSCSTTFEVGVDLGDLDTIFLRNVPPEAFNYVQRVGRSGRRSGSPGFAITYCRRGPHDLYHFAEPRRILSGKVRPPVLSLRNEKIITRHITATALSYFFRNFKDKFKTVENFFNDLSHPSGVADFKTFLNEQEANLKKSLQAIVPPEIAGRVGLENKDWMAKVAGEKSRLFLAEAEVSSDYQNVIELEKSARENRNYRTAEWARKRADTIAKEEFLSFLSRKAVIPKYGFPVDVVELDTQSIQHGEAKEISLQRDLAIAVSEFAPTSKLIANKKIWTSYGLKRVAGQEWDRWWYARCPIHNRFERKPWRDEKRLPSFNKCCAHMFPAQYLDPRFGFVTNREKPEEPKRRPDKVFTTRPYFAGFKDKEGNPINFGSIRLTTATPGYLVVLCEGRRGRGFYICERCGAGFQQPKKKHETSYGSECSGTLVQVSLGHEFVTDVLQLQFHAKTEEATQPVWFAYSLAYALVEGAASEVLEVPSTDLNATVAYSSQTDSLPPIILYDNVPGGAGLVAQLEKKEMLQACLEAAWKRVSGNCGCDEGTSCYGCLRSYRNQFAHPYLQRGPVLRYLKTMLLEWESD
ncbi:MAG TPA: DEAD/DEAH box helicase [Candidatus Limnocylindrales bacterium]|nr:DEAD/DEAH box helicase [Candidatus Limnocylindrales bacterium]